MATMMKVPPYSNIITLYLVPVCILAVITLPLVVTRIYTRLTRTKKLYLDDWLILVAEPLSVINVCLGIAAAAHGWGKPVPYIAPAEYKQIMKLQFAIQFTWLIPYCLVRLSVASSLLRFGKDKAWRWPLYGLMGLQAAITTSYTVIQFGQCRPLSSNWEYVPDVKCWDIQPIINYGWAIGAIYVIMDLILSLMPIRLIRTLTRPTSEKLLICVLMALGLLATSVACIKMTTFNDFGKGDPLQATIKPSMLAKVEEQTGILASCLPCLKSPAQNLLKKFGVLQSHQLTRPSFVNTVSLPNMNAPKDHDQRSSGEGSVPQKDDIRVDSVSVKPGSSDSNSNPKPSQKQGWSAV
ncbi:hypothetical protein B0J11DRAFT_498144 [Dendryphion nanum]|uniref:Rhodopsin domain-containing protein n=1 Tax=Dendryphion nanum TaxID=256645 RepID=A0A9P9D4I4_9PLEO|nr:hypothetical protein B0J11DRAFT_498144 [Dendryphion nanum]